VLAPTTRLVSPRRIAQLAAVIKPSMLLKIHKLLVDHKYPRLFFSSSHRRKPGAKGPSAVVSAAIVGMKWRNPRFGCVRIAQQISCAFGLQIENDVVGHYRPGSGAEGPSQADPAQPATLIDRFSNRSIINA
jgi:putative transposase